MWWVLSVALLSVPQRQGQGAGTEMRGCPRSVQGLLLDEHRYGKVEQLIALPVMVKRNLEAPVSIHA